MCVIYSPGYEVNDYITGDEILPPHVTYRTINKNVLKELKAENKIPQVPLSSGQALTRQVLLHSKPDITHFAPRR